MTPQLLIDTQPLTLHLTEGDDGKTIRFKGEFGRVDKATANGRFYSPKLMEREIKRLMQPTPDGGKLKVMGELDHPCLTTDDFRVLTLDGWKSFQDVTAGDKVWSRVDGKAVVSTVDEVVDEPYMGPAIRFKGRSIDATFTPAHRFLTVKRPSDDGRGEEAYVLAGKIADGMGKHAHDAIPKTATWVSENVDTFVVPGVTTTQSYRCKNDVTQALHIDAKVFASFMGIYLAEGCCSSDSTDTYAVFICQRPGWSADYIYDEVLSKFPEEIQWTYDGRVFYTADARLRSYLKPLGNVYEKHIPAEVKTLGQECLNELVFWFGIGDGRMVASNCKGDHGLAEDGKTFKEVAADRLRNGEMVFTRQDVFSVSERLVRDLHECVVRSGRSGVISVVEQVGDREIEGRVIKEEDRRPLFQLHIAHSKNIWLDPRFLKTEVVDHDGNIYCLKTTHGSFYMERDGHAWWTGNSDGRTKLQRVSHVVKSLAVEFPQVIGEAIPLDTPNGRILSALAKASVAIGVSSRGYGSTKPRGDGVEEVQEDFRLDTYDFVYQPADETAYPTMYAEEKDLVRALEDGTMELTLDVLRKDYPELVEMIVAEAEATASSTLITEDERDRVVQTAVTEAVTEAETRTERRVKEQLTSGLLSEMEIVQEAALEQARSEAASDPKVAGAIGLCEQIAAIIQPFGVAPDTKTVIDQKDEEIAVLEAKIAERELEVQKVQREAKENAELAKEAAFSLHIERELRTEEETRRNAIVNLIGPISAFESKKALDDRVEAVIAELDSAKPDPVEEDERSEFEQRLEALEQGMIAASERAEKAESLVKEANERTRKALDAAEEMAAQGYAEGIATTHHDGDKLRSLAEEATSIEAVDKIVTSLGEPPADVSHVVAQADDTVMEAIRRRIASGKERDLEEEHTGRGPSQQDKDKNQPPSNRSNGKGLFEELDLSQGEFDRLAGNTPRQ